MPTIQHAHASEPGTNQSKDGCICSNAILQARNQKLTLLKIFAFGLLIDTLRIPSNKAKYLIKLLSIHAYVAQGNPP